MNNEELLKQNELLQEKIQMLEKELNETKEHLKKYTAPSRNKDYYENHKEEIIKKIKSKPIDPEKRKEYNHNSYLKRKQKLNKE